MTNRAITKSIFSAVTVVLCIAATAYSQQSANQQNNRNGIDIACGNGGQGLAWYRYLITEFGEGTRLYHQSEYSPLWFMSIYLPAANKIISYGTKGSGNHAVCSVYGSDIYASDDGGLIWQPCGFPRDYNRRFTALEILNWQSPGHTIFVGTESDGSSPTAYYTTNGGRSWYRLGGGPDDDPMYGITVNDIESLASGELVAGTVDGIFRYDDDYNSPWQRAAFEGNNVTAIDNIELGLAQQVAAVKSVDGVSRLYYTSDAWDAEINEIKADDLSLVREIRDLSAIYWGESRISCYLATDNGAFLVAFNHTNPTSADLIDLGSMNDDLAGIKDMNAVDYHISYDNGTGQATVLMTGIGGVYEIREYRNSPQAIDSLVVSEISDGAFPGAGP